MIGRALDTIVCWIRWLAQGAASYVVDAFEFILSVLIGAVNVALGLLPTMAATERPQLTGGVLGTFNYIIPFSGLALQFGALLVAWVAYRVFQWLLKWGKAAD